MSDRGLKTLLKCILNDRTEALSKLDLLFQLECMDVDSTGLSVALDVLRVLQSNTHLNDPLQLLRSQALQTSTTLLLICNNKYGPNSVKALLASHIDLLMTYCNGSDANLKAVASICLSEIQLCSKDLLGPCVAIIDTLAAFEASAAHQPLLQLLALLATEEQTAAFLIAQLPLLSIPATSFIANRLATLATLFLIQPFLQQILVTFNLTALSVAIRLAHFLDDFGRLLLLNNIVGLSTDPGLSVASRLVLLDMATYFSNYWSLTLVPPDINFADGAHSKLKKIAIRLNLPFDQSKVAVIESAVEDAASTKHKAVNAKVIYLASKNEQLSETCKRILLSSTLRDLSFAPHLLQLVQQVPELELPNLITSILSSNHLHLHHLPFFVMLLKQAVASRSSAVARPKESLNLAAHLINSSTDCLLPNEAHKLLSTCHQIIKVFDPADFTKEMGELLTAVAAKCTEEDVAARVSSFESLLSCLADSKVREVLRSQKKGLVPGFFHKPQSVTILDQPIINLQIAKTIHPIPNISDEPISSKTDPLPSYWPLIQSFNRSQIKIPLTVSSEGNENLEAAALFFEPLAPFGQIEPLLIGRISTKNKALGAFTPERPYPVTFAVRAEFRINGRMCCCPMQDLKIGLAALLQPLPGSLKKQVAKAMWERMTDWPQASVVLQQEEAKAKLKELKPFLVASGSNFMASFLAPSSHLLIKFGATDEPMVKISIKTDDVILLAHANDFLCKFK